MTKQTNQWKRAQEKTQETDIDADSLICMLRNLIKMLNCKP